MGTRGLSTQDFRVEKLRVTSLGVEQHEHEDSAFHEMEVGLA